MLHCAGGMKGWGGLILLLIADQSHYIYSHRPYIFIHIHNIVLKGLPHEISGGYCYISIDNSFQGLRTPMIKIFYLIKERLRDEQKIVQCL